MLTTTLFRILETRCPSPPAFFSVEKLLLVPERRKSHLIYLLTIKHVSLICLCFGFVYYFNAVGTTRGVVMKTPAFIIALYSFKYILSSFHVKIIMSINSSYTSSNQVLLLVYVKNTWPKDERKRKGEGEKGKRLKLVSCDIKVKVIIIINWNDKEMIIRNRSKIENYGNGL